MNSGRLANPRVNPPHSAVTARAYRGTRRAAGRAGYAHRYADNIMWGALIAVLSALAPVAAGEQPRVAIYLVAPEQDCPLATTPDSASRPVSVGLENVEHATEPWVTDAEVNAFDPATATLTLTDGLQLPYPPTSVRGTLFVIEVDGKPELIGAFWSPWSSFCCCSLPIIETKPDLANKKHPDGLARRFRIQGLPGDSRISKVFGELGKVDQ